MSSSGKKKPHSLPPLNVLLGLSDQQLVIASMTAFLDPSCACQHANYGVRREPKAGLKNCFIHYFTLLEWKSKIADGNCQKSMLFSLLYSGIQDSVEGNLVPQKALRMSDPVEDPQWEIWGWQRTWKVLLTPTGNSRKSRNFLRTEGKAGIYSNQLKIKTSYIISVFEKDFLRGTYCNYSCIPPKEKAFLLLY